MSSTLRKKLAGKTTKLAKPRQKMDDHPANLNNYEDGSFYKIPLEVIMPDPNQPRQYFDPEALAELSRSIEQKGVLQPVIVRRDEAGTFWLVAGERRFRAAKTAGIEAIPAIITKGNPAEIALIENIQRENLKPIEEAEAYERMIKEYNYTQEQLAQVIGKGRTTITQTLSLNNLPEEIKNECPRADIPKRILVEIARKETPEEMIALFNQVKDGNLKGDQVRKAVRKRTKRTLRTPAAIALDRTLHLANYLPKLDLANAEENEKVQLITELQNLKNLIDDFIN